MAWYSGAPLPKKLGIAEDSSLFVWRAPAEFSLELPARVTVKRQAKGAMDVVVAFFTEHRNYAKQLERFGQLVFPNGGLWIAWPKKSSAMTTDMTDDLVRALALPIGLVDNKVCALDATWTGLRLVWRRERRN